MKVLLIQRHAGYRFMGLFTDAFAACGHDTHLVPHEQLPGLQGIVNTVRPDLVFTVQLAPFLFGLPVPTIHYELDKIMNWDLLRDHRPGPKDMFFVTYRDDIAPLRAAGAAFVEYLPFCANIDTPRPPAQACRHEVTFAGSILHESGNQYRSLVATIRSAFANNPAARPIADEVLNTFESILKRQDRALAQNRYVLPEEVRKQVRGVTAEVIKAAQVSPATLVAILAKEAAHRQRLLLLKRAPELTVFGEGDWPAALPQATYGGLIPQFAGIGPVFNQSRVNLNIQRIYALSGLSDRVFNVTASGGFLLSDRNAAVQEVFQEDRDAAMFSSPDELADKARFYLAQERERLRIAQSGYERTLREHMPVHRVRAMLRHMS